ncbi:hypothetical protein ERO13_D10G071484v2, partial [Gossypium hirsutum]
KYEVKEFTRKNSFHLWSIKIQAILIQQVLLKEQKDEILDKEHSVILLCLGNEVLREVAEKTMTSGLWLQLERKYMTKPLMN